MIFKDGNSVGFVYKDGQAVEKIFQNGNLVFEQGFEREVSGVPPLTLNAVRNTTENYRIFGNNSGIGDRTENLLPLEDNKSFTLKGVTITCSNGRIYLTGAPTGEVLNSDNPIFMQNFSFTVSAGKYNFIIKSNTDRLNLDIFRYISDNDTYIQRLDAINAGIYTLTVSQDNTVLFLKIYYRNGVHQITPTSPLEVMVCREEITEYEPYGYKIPVISGNQTTNIYLSEPLYNGDYVSYSEQAVHKSDSTVKSVELPEISLTKGLNTLSIGTTVQPSDVYIKYKGR